jgi:hypothetical protein
MRRTPVIATATAPLCRHYAHPAREHRAELDLLRLRYRDALHALAAAEARARRTERLLRSRLLELTWPAALSALAGGFAGVVLLRIAGL